ncbi:cupin domain-containing protein [Erwiniaceae bacterium BAC15a-03b]|uniref:Cupin domain-containing protein n=1 Tax=Winslowiella arboricola TaxID=2978220 RepID=A0A9J6PWL2_9GAMM|nr:cupin domain-containing protein [Winslowiella arboricola]MCU5774739.1 cupin domain-containing protein [Winslowiella arboricola]MCU5780109.1 cupin domain-containing protein [Winslowiella arboricola]
MRLITQFLSFCTSLAFLITPFSIMAESGSTAGVNVEKLLETEQSWDGVFYKRYPKGTPQISVLKITVAPNTALAWHEHPIPNAGYVLSGRLTVENKTTGEKRLLKAGEVLAEMVDGAHRGYTGKEGVMLVVFYAGQKGIPLSTPAE